MLTYPLEGSVSQIFTSPPPPPPPYPDISNGQYLPSNDIPCVFREREEEGAEKILTAPINV